MKIVERSTLLRTLYYFVVLSVVNGFAKSLSTRHNFLCKSDLNKLTLFNTRTQNDSLTNSDNTSINLSAALKTVSAVALISAPLGILLDNQHGLFGVLNYAQWNMNIIMDDSYVLKSAYWVPVLFSFAGLAMSTIILALDSLLITTSEDRTPDWSKVLYGISLFSGQYYLSGALDYLNIEPLVINIILSIIAFIGFYIFDKSKSGVLLAVATAITGPVVEISLINFTHIYSYTHTDGLGICTWIPAVYFLGGPAVGNLARRIYKDFGG